MHISTMAKAYQQGVNAIGTRNICQVLWMESQCRASMTAQLNALHSISVHGMIQGKALVMEDALHRNTYGAAARRDLADLTARRDPPLSPREQHELLECVVPMVAARRALNPLHSRRRTRSIYDVEERNEMHAHRPGVTPSNGRERGKRPKIGS